MLLKYGADIDSTSLDKGRTALHIILGISIEYHWKRYKLINTLKTLLKNGANLHIKDLKGKTPLDLAIASKNEAAINVIKEFQSK
ncbi:MAG: ankyrin repeat protein [Maribacter sp.]|jgi:ankyrin repeat protein